MNRRTPIRLLLSLLLAIGILAAPIRAAEPASSPRRVVSLDGTWNIAQGSLDAIPDAFPGKVPVPGLVDMAEPAFKEVGKSSKLRQAFWYQRTFTLDGPLPAVARLKIHKAKYGIKVFLNGHLIGEYMPCFTPAYFDVHGQLEGEGQPNELVIRVGADREAMPEGVPNGWDFEKYLYFPGVYDSVELILAGFPYVRNVQTVPDIGTGRVRILAELEAGAEPCKTTLQAKVTEAKSGRRVGDGSASVVLSSGQQRVFDLTVPIENCRLWSPEDPFLYRLTLDTGGDAVDLRFGMRSFHFDPVSRRAVLNGKPRYLRGTNVCVLRFFEDEHRGDRPWRREWVRRLHRKFKSMHWDTIRYCIGFPPELWYEIADEEGLLIQDEFPIWLLSKAPEHPTAEHIIPQYRAWMRERWNHPCVVIWDAQNESVTHETGIALQAVRHLDYSNRPWENGWSAPQSTGDCVESHPYLFIRGWTKGPVFRLEEVAELSGAPHLNNEQKQHNPPILINEYAWLWLNRDGTPTCLTKRAYQSLLGPDSTTEQRRVLYAKYLAALTEFWRAHRECAGVLHFCGLGYSRSGDKPRPEGGATSDHFTDLEKLTFEPNFERYVRDAFHPVGVMLDFWAAKVECGLTQSVRVLVINDLPEAWQGTVRLRVTQGETEISRQELPCRVEGLGREILTFTVQTPSDPGTCTMVAELTSEPGGTIRSHRDFEAVRK